jgi:hypothetical protein
MMIGIGTPSNQRSAPLAMVVSIVAGTTTMQHVLGSERVRRRVSVRRIGTTGRRA